MYAIERIPRDRADASPLAFLYFLRHLAPLTFAPYTVPWLRI